MPKILRILDFCFIDFLSIYAKTRGAKIRGVKFKGAQILIGRRQARMLRSKSQFIVVSSGPAMSLLLARY